MANLLETPHWEDGIYQFETSDFVEGGVNGIDNVPSKQLANRTVWLKEAIQAEINRAANAELANETAISDEISRATSAENARVQSVDSVFALLSAPTTIPQASVAAYHTGWAVGAVEPKGGGNFVYDAAMPKTSHNGGTIISNTVPWPTGSVAEHPAFLAGTGETTPAGTGCWVRRDNIISATQFGANGIDDQTAIQKAVDYCIASQKSFEDNSNLVITGPIYWPQYRSPSNVANRICQKFEFSGSLTVNGAFIGLNVYGSGVHIHVAKAYSLGNSSIIKFVDLGFSRFTFGELYGAGSTGDGVTIAGAFDVDIAGSQISGFYRNFYTRVSDASDNLISPFTFTNSNFPANNYHYVVARTGGEFSSLATVASSAEFGLYLTSGAAGWVETNAEYCIRTANSVGIYIGSEVTSLRGRVYLETCNLHFIECYGNDCKIEVTGSETNRALNLEYLIRGTSNKISFRKRTALSGNAFFPVSLAQDSFSTTDTNIVDGVESEVPVPYAAIQNRLLSPSTLGTSWVSTSPTGGVTVPTLVTGRDAIFTANGGALSTIVTTNDAANTYQYGQAVVFPASQVNAFLTLDCYGISGTTRLMLKIVDGATIKYKVLTLVGATKLQRLALSLPTPSINLSVTLQILGTAAAQCAIGNICLTEHSNGLRESKGYTTLRPTTVGGVAGKTLFPAVFNDGSKKNSYISIQAGVTFQTLDYEYYKVVPPGANQTHTLPVIAAGGCDGQEVTFFRDTTVASAIITISCGAGDTFSDGTTTRTFTVVNKMLKIFGSGTVWNLVVDR